MTEDQNTETPPLAAPTGSPRYAYSTDEEFYTGDFSSRAEAAAEAFAEDEDLESVMTGICVVPPRRPWASDLIETVAAQTTDEAGEWADDYLQNVPKAAVDELQEGLQALWDQWEKKHGLEPTWFNVEKVKEHRRDEVNSDYPNQ